MLFITYRPWEAQDKIGLPIDIEQTYTEVFNENKPMEALNSRDWRRYSRHHDGVPVPPEFKLPPHLIMVCKGLRKFNPDFFTQTITEWIVSAPFLAFLKKHQLLEGYYEESTLSVVSTANKPIATKQYHFLRIIKNDNDLIDFEKTPKVISPKKRLTKHTPPTIYYPDLIFKEGVEIPKMLFLDDPSYWYSFICAAEVKEEMEQLAFLGFDFYTLADYVSMRLEREKIFAR
ncbi:MAG: hypothetical protein EOO55_03500 [Hymenobacter sp.]|nr:MAG: hypothetical protein EOO55_03500 [Hymenobacter sp.]